MPRIMLTSMASALLTKSRPRILEALLAHVAVCARALHKPCRGAKWISEDHSAGAAGVTRGPFCGRGCWQDASVDLIGVVKRTRVRAPHPTGARRPRRPAPQRPGPRTLHRMASSTRHVRPLRPGIHPKQRRHQLPPVTTRSLFRQKAPGRRHTSAPAMNGPSIPCMNLRWSALSRGRPTSQPAMWP